ncbi:MAG: hypothetical protein PUB21_12980 [Bacteroidales bacterium]|nr:hypothetical protein [Bacteroidales bacterium]
MMHSISKRIGLFFVVVLLMCVLPAKGEQTYIKASVDSAALLIGQQTRIHIDVTTDQGKVLQLPVFGDTIMNGVEVIGIDKLDTTMLDNQRMQLRQSVLVTSFDSALYYIPPFKVIDGLDTVYSDPLALKVSTIPLDQVNPDEIYDIKGVWKPAFVLSDYLLWIIIPLIIILLCVAAYFIYKYMKKRNEGRKVIAPEKLIPPHEKALTELNKIKEEKIWSQGRTKEYYTQLTDVLRVYIDERFHIDAMEMTTSELLSYIKGVPEAQPILDKLKSILSVADLVKFAKYVPLFDENESSLQNAYLIVESTKVIPKVPDEDENKEDDSAPNSENSETKDE